MTAKGNKRGMIIRALARLKPGVTPAQAAAEGDGARERGT